MDQQLSTQELILDNLEFAENFAKRYLSHFRYQDIRNACLLGICEAADRWDPTKNVLFTTYAIYWMRNYINKELRNSNREYITGSVYDIVCNVDDDSIASPDILSRLLHLIEKLPKIQQHVILLRYPLDSSWEEYNDVQIAQMLKISPTWVKQQRLLAFATLREELSKLDTR